MGIHKDRFEDENHSLFVCALCQDVAEGPVILSCCDSIVCLSCHEASLSNKYSITDCDQEHDEDTKWNSLQKQLNLLYSRLSVKCLNDGCDLSLPLPSVKAHEEACPHKQCSVCGSKDLGEDHGCLNWLKNRNLNLNEELEKVRGQLLEARRIETETLEKLNEIKLFLQDQNGSEFPRRERRSVEKIAGSNLGIVFNEDETTATEDVKNMILKGFFSSSRRDMSGRMIETCSYVDEMTGKKWILRQKGHIDLTLFKVPRDTFCSFEYGGKRFVAFQGNINRSQPGSLNGQVDGVHERIRNILIPFNLHVHKTGDPNVARNRNIGIQIESELGGKAASFGIGDLTYAIYSQDGFFWECYTYSRQEIPIYSGVKTVKFVKEVTKIHSQARCKIVRCLIENFHKHRAGRTLASSATEGLRNQIGGRWSGFVSDDAPLKDDSARGWAVVHFFNNEKFVFYSMDHG